MRIVTRLNDNAVNTRKTQTHNDLIRMFTPAPNMAAKTIRLFPQYSISMLTEGLGEIYDVKTKTDRYTPVNDTGYKWKLKGNNSMKVKIASTYTPAAFSGANGIPFVLCLENDNFNPNDIIRVPVGSTYALLFVTGTPENVGPNQYNYIVKLVSRNKSEAIPQSALLPGKEVSYSYNAHPELSERGYLTSRRQMEEHVNYLTRIRHSFSVSGDAAATKYLIEDIVNMDGKKVVNNYITDQLFMDAMESFHFSKEMSLIYGKSTMDPSGKCFLQDGQGRDIETGDGILEQLSNSCKQTYTRLTINLLRDIISYISLRMPKRTGNEILLTTGIEGYKEFQNLMDDLHAARFTTDDNYVQSVNGKYELGMEYSAYKYMGNKIIVNCNNVFDHPGLPSEVDNQGRRIESFRMLFLDISSYDGVKNIEMVAKDGRSFIVGEIDGIGGQDGKTSGKVSTSVDGSSKHILGHCGIVLHNPYSSFMLERALV